MDDLLEVFLIACVAVLWMVLIGIIGLFPMYLLSLTPLNFGLCTAVYTVWLFVFAACVAHYQA